MSNRSDVAGIDECLVRVVDRERVAAVQESMPPAEDVEQVADVFALLGDPNRLRLLAALLEGGEMGVRDLAAAAGPDDVLPARGRARADAPGRGADALPAHPRAAPGTGGRVTGCRSEHPASGLLQDPKS